MAVLKQNGYCLQKKVFFSKVKQIYLIKKMKKYLTFLLFTLVFLPYTSADPDSEENAPEYKPDAGVFGY